MSFAARLLRSVALHGARLAVEDGRLILYDGDNIPATTKAALKKHKAEIIALLTDDLDGLPLAAKLRAYGKPYPLMVDGRVAAWLVPDAEAKVEKSEPVYTATEVIAVAKGERLKEAVIDE